MPAAAVIPAPVAYIKVAAVKKLVVGFLVRSVWPVQVTVRVLCFPAILPQNISTLYWVGGAMWNIYFEKIRVFKAGICSEYISMG